MSTTSTTEQQQLEFEIRVIVFLHSGHSFSHRSEMRERACQMRGYQYPLLELQQQSVTTGGTAAPPRHLPGIDSFFFRPPTPTADNAQATSMSDALARAITHHNDDA
uniref:Uncharacterized protein n=1 Tax=Pristionchus pacificus TaxID=54126 RepID=A0A2A6CP59_PRIPA|eukprot:PDM80005.1 hypothetical protein PRIPAC_32584 [Pristionchus pacificus]